MFTKGVRYAFIASLAFAGFVHADQPSSLDDNTGYISLGDSLAAGKGAIPVTNGFAYLLYQGGVFDKMTNTNFANAAVPGATSADVLAHQIPQATDVFFRLQPRNVVTLSVGANDLLALIDFTQFPPSLPPVGEVQAALASIGGRIFSSLAQLCTKVLPSGQPAPREEVQGVYVANLYSIRSLPLPPDFLNQVEMAIQGFNMTVAHVVRLANEHGGCAGRATVADVYGEFSGSQQGLLLINRKGAGPFEVHPTNAGYRAMAAAFIAAHQQP